MSEWEDNEPMEKPGDEWGGEVMSGPLDAAIKILHEASGEAIQLDMLDVELSCDSAIRVLEAAGRVNPRECETFLCRVNEDEDMTGDRGMRSYPLMQIRNLLEAIPSDKGEPK